MPGRCSGVGGKDVLVGKGVCVGVAGNHTTVCVADRVGDGLGVDDGENVVTGV